MKNTIILTYLCAIIFIINNVSASDCNSTIYEYTTKTIDGDTLSLSVFKEKVLLIINIPTFNLDTSRMIAYEKLYEKYHKKGFEILVFPSAQMIKYNLSYKDKAIKYDSVLEYNIKELGLTFTICEIIRNDEWYQYPLYDFLLNRDYFGITFESDYIAFIVDRNGKVVTTYDNIIKPSEIIPDLEMILENNHYDD